MPSRGSFDITTVLRTTESPWRTITAPFACSAARPVSIDSRLPAISTFFVVIDTRIPPCVGRTAARCDEVRFLAAAAELESSVGVVKELTPRHRGVLPLLTCPQWGFFLSPDPELSDESAIALHVDVPQV